MIAYFEGIQEPTATELCFAEAAKILLKGNVVYIDDAHFKTGINNLKLAIKRWHR